MEKQFEKTPVVLMEINVPKGFTEKIRLNDFLVGKHPTLQSRSGTKKAIKGGKILINGEECTPEIWVQEGQQISILDIEKKTIPIFNIKFPVLFEDEFLAIINKPAGVPVNGNFHRSIEHALPNNIKNSRQGDALPFPRVVHRLDALTSGLLIIAKTIKAEILLKQQFEKHQINKEYTAVVNGKLPYQNGEINTPIDEQESLSKYHVIRVAANPKCGHLSLVQLYPCTGRTHQLRKHLESLQTPIVGDELYSGGKSVFKGKGLFLCATYLRFHHPIFGNEIEFRMAPPAKFEKLMDWGERSIKAESKK